MLPFGCYAHHSLICRLHKPWEMHTVPLWEVKSATVKVPSLYTLCYNLFFTLFLHLTASFALISCSSIIPFRVVCYFCSLILYLILEFCVCFYSVSSISVYICVFIPCNSLYFVSFFLVLYLHLCLISLLKNYIFSLSLQRVRYLLVLAPAVESVLIDMWYLISQNHHKIIRDVAV